MAEPFFGHKGSPQFSPFRYAHEANRATIDQDVICIALGNFARDGIKQFALAIAGDTGNAARLTFVSSDRPILAPRSKLIL